MGLLKRPSVTSNIEETIKDTEADKIMSSELAEIEKNINLKKVVSTGSTLLDLAISGGNTPEGGIPGGIFVEFFGPSGAGKTALLSELSASVQNQGGDVRFCDPEARLDQEYSRIYGVNVAENFEYYRPDTVSGMFTDYIWPWSPKDPNKINLIASDSIAALSTDLEMDNDDGDKMGMRRAKEFSEGLRKTCRLVANRQWLIAFSNQIRTGEGGKDTAPGGKAIEFYASLRIRVKPFWQNSKIVKKVKLNSGVTVEDIIGIRSECYIQKSSLDKPYRSAPISVVFGYGIDTIRDELQYHKDMTKSTSYDCIGKSCNSMELALRYVEENNLERDIKKRTITLWNEIQEKFKSVRKQKIR